MEPNDLLKGGAVNQGGGKGKIGLQHIWNIFIWTHTICKFEVSCYFENHSRLHPIVSLQFWFFSNILSQFRFCSNIPSQSWSSLKCPIALMYLAKIKSAQSRFCSNVPAQSESANMGSLKHNAIIWDTCLKSILKLKSLGVVGLQIMARLDFDVVNKSWKFWNFIQSKSIGY